DGIRDGHVTGVQTCALPISRQTSRPSNDQLTIRLTTGKAPSFVANTGDVRSGRVLRLGAWVEREDGGAGGPAGDGGLKCSRRVEIGRASCRERGGGAGGTGG